jgi:HmuY protein
MTDRIFVPGLGQRGAVPAAGGQADPPGAADRSGPALPPGRIGAGPEGEDLEGADAEGDDLERDDAEGEDLERDDAEGEDLERDDAKGPDLERNHPEGDEVAGRRADAGQPRTGSRVAIAAVLLLAIGAVAMVMFSLSRPQPPEFTAAVHAVPEESGAGSFRFTVEAADPESWRFISLATGTLVDAADSWDLAFRRFHIISNGGAGFRGAGGVIDAGSVPIDSVALAAGAVVEETIVAGDSSNPAIARWYRYGLTSHLLTPLDRTYIVRAADGRRHYALRVLSYYCIGARPGCVTIRYRPL